MELPSAAPPPFLVEQRTLSQWLDDCFWIGVGLVLFPITILVIVMMNVKETGNTMREEDRNP